jgi:hypothetical protein
MWCLDDIDPMSEAYRRKSRWLSTEPGETLHKTGVDGDVFGGMVEQSADLQQKRSFRWSTVRSEANADHVGLLKQSRDPKNRWHESMHFFTRYWSFFMFVLEIPCMVALLPAANPICSVMSRNWYVEAVGCFVVRLLDHSSPETFRLRASFKILKFVLI